jgi:hypothetical protein
LTSYIEIDCGEYKIKAPDWIVIDYTFPATEEGLARAVECRDDLAFITKGKSKAEIKLHDPNGEAIQIKALYDFFAHQEAIHEVMKSIAYCVSEDEDGDLIASLLDLIEEANELAPALLTDDIPVLLGDYGWKLDGMTPIPPLAASPSPALSTTHSTGSPPMTIAFALNIAAVEARLIKAGITASETLGAVAYWTAPDSHKEGRGTFVKARRHEDGWKLESANPTTMLPMEDDKPTIGLHPLILKAARLRGDDLDGFAIHADWMTETPGGDPILVNEFELPRYAEMPTMANIIDAWTPPQPPKLMTGSQFRAAYAA